MCFVGGGSASDLFFFAFIFLNKILKNLMIPSKTSYFISFQQLDQIRGNNSKQKRNEFQKGVKNVLVSGDPIDAVQ